MVPEDEEVLRDDDDEEVIDALEAEKEDGVIAEEEVEVGTR